MTRAPITNAFCAAFLLHDPFRHSAMTRSRPGLTGLRITAGMARMSALILSPPLRGHAGFAAIQCKFYAPCHKIAKADIDSFLAASSKPPFTDRIVMDSTEGEWSANAEDMLIGQTIPVRRIGLLRDAASPINGTAFPPDTTSFWNPEKNCVRISAGHLTLFAPG